MQNLLRFFEQASRLKTTPRAGWRRCGVQPCESVAEHTFGVALLALVLPRLAGLNVRREHCIALALVHDLAEAIVGDITPHDGVEAPEKRRREEQAVRALAESLGDDEILTLWLEFEEAKTPEAQLVRDLDVIEMTLQAKAYERIGSLSADQARGFIDSARSRIRTAAAREMLDALTK